MFWKLTIAVVAIAGLGGSGLSERCQPRPGQGGLALPGKEGDRETVPPTQPTAAVPVKLKENLPWDGFISLTQDEENAIGLKTDEVKKQDQPIKLELTGRTAYDPDSLTKIRLRFDASVEKVHGVARPEDQGGRPARRAPQHRPGRGQERLPEQVRPVAARQEPARRPPRPGQQGGDLAQGVRRHPERRAEEPARLHPGRRQAPDLQGPRRRDRRAARRAWATSRSRSTSSARSRTRPG